MIVIKFFCIIFSIIAFGTMAYFFIMDYVLTIKSFKLFWKSRKGIEFDQLGGDRVLLFVPVFFPLKKFKNVLDLNKEMNSKRITVFITQVQKLKVSFLIGMSSSMLMMLLIFLGKSYGADWIN